MKLEQQFEIIDNPFLALIKFFFQILHSLFLNAKTTKFILGVKLLSYKHNFLKIFGATPPGNPS